MKLGFVTQMAVAAFLVGAGTAAYAQGTAGESKQPGATKQAPQSGSQAAPSRGGTGGAVQQPGAGGAQKPDAADTTQQKMQPQQKMQRGEQAPDRKGERKAGESQQRMKEDSQRQAKEKSKGEATKGAGGGAGLRPDLSDQQRTSIRQHLSAGPRVSDVDVSISVGSVLPRRVELRPLPATVIEIVPEYRGYHFVLVGSQIVIVDPDTYEIIAVLAA